MAQVHEEQIDSAIVFRLVIFKSLLLENNEELRCRATCRAWRYGYLAHLNDVRRAIEAVAILHRGPMALEMLAHAEDRRRHSAHTASTANAASSHLLDSPPLTPRFGR